MTDAIAAIASVLSLAWAMVVHPTHAACARGWFLDEGIQRDGAFRCVQRWTNNESPLATRPSGVIRGRIYCSGGSRPIQVQDGQTVGCQR